MKVFNVTSGFDIGGQGIRLKQAFDRYAPDWTYRVMASRNAFFNYPIDLAPRRAWEREQWAEADVVHLRNHFAVYDRNSPKPAVVHYHGSLFRGDPSRHIREQRARGAMGIVSTLDLWLLASDDTEWLPAPYDVDWLEAMR